MIISIALLVPILPFLLLGDSFESQIQDWVQQNSSRHRLFWLIVVALSLDILLPVPSSGVSTYAGGVLGITGGALASWLGMTTGAVIGFFLARILGASFAERFGGKDVSLLRGVTDRYGTAALLATRPLPILAEACVLLLGATKFSWRRFLPPLFLGNLVISLAYAVFGASLSERESLPTAVIVSVLLPLTAALLLRRRLQSRD